jgi:simple sugar transport system permease protein
VPGIAPLPLPAPLDHEPLAYAALALAAFASWWLRRTAGGLELRAIGDHPLAADVAGVPVARVRARAVVIGAALAGLGGADLALAQAHAWSESMTSGRGFLALAVVILGRRGPLGVLGAALLFGAAAALEPVLKARGAEVPRALIVTLPYVLTLGALALAGGRRPDDPAALGVPYRRGE